MKENKRSDHVGKDRTLFEKNRKKIMMQSEICGICGQMVDKSIKNYLDPLAPVIDHIIPINKGGHPSDINNLQLAHRWCNRQKSDKLIDLKRLFTDSETDVSNQNLPLHYDWKNYKAN